MNVWPNQIIDYLAMVGDTSDNVPGMRGIGAKGAVKLLGEYKTLDKCVEAKDAFKGKKLTTAFSDYLDDAYLSRELVTIVTDLELNIGPKDAAFKLKPDEDVIEFLKKMGFKGIVQRWQELVGGEKEAGSSEIKLKSMLIANDAALDPLLKSIGKAKKMGLGAVFESDGNMEQKINSLSVSLDGKKSFVVKKTGLVKKTLKAIWKNKNCKVFSDRWKKFLALSMQMNTKVECSYFDVVQIHYILENQGPHELKALAERYLFQALPAEDDPGFAAMQGYVLYKLIDIFEKELKEKDLLEVYTQMDQPLIPILAKMEKEGIYIDEKFFKDFEGELDKKIKVVEKKIFTYNDGETLNLNSPKQVSAFLFEKLQFPALKKIKTGLSTDSEVLEKLAAKNISPVPELMLAYREMGKLLSTYIRSLPALINKKTGRLHTHFEQHIAATGRLASNHPNLQNIPIRTELGNKIREGFTAQKGMVFLGADYSQIELRLLAHLSGDPIMIQSFQEGKDIHRQTASEILGVALDEVTSQERSRAKTVNFGLMYGQSSFGLANQLGINRAQARDYITVYFERFCQVKSYLDSLREEAERKGYTETLWGRKRFLPNISSSNRNLKAMAERMAINTPIQGTAADIIKIAMIEIDRQMNKAKLKSKMLLQVHDELIFEVPKDEIEEMIPLVREGMEGVADLHVPLVVDISTGPNWRVLK